MLFIGKPIGRSLMISIGHLNDVVALGKGCGALLVEWIDRP